MKNLAIAFIVWAWLSACNKNTVVPFTQAEFAIKILNSDLDVITDSEGVFNADSIIVAINNSTVKLRQFSPRGFPQSFKIPLHEYKFENGKFVFKPEQVQPILFLYQNGEVDSLTYSYQVSSDSNLTGKMYLNGQEVASAEDLMYFVFNIVK